jgi:hypothetical protein
VLLTSAKTVFPLNFTFLARHPLLCSSMCKTVFS